MPQRRRDNVADPTVLGSRYKAIRAVRVMVIAHIGNVDLARALLPPETRARLTLLVHTRHAVHYNRVMSEYRPEAAMNMIQVTEPSARTRRYI